ncbi:hypothetical protein ACJMK2_011314 [Sinanodonta woodiana]|uniref:G-protein coupled receptors family 1 profile domain-containing protein n=1 Tax=Sinanodonta woodiana TaxID=1069815 RepID=A0ABD3V4M8_SINWO
MNISENNTAGLTDLAGRNMSGGDLNFEMSGYMFSLYTAYLAGSMIIGIPGNFILLAIYYKHKPLSNVDCYMLSIAVCDLVCLVATVPVYIVIQTKLLYVIDANTLCKALNFAGQILTFAESFLLSALAFERFITVCRPKSSCFHDHRVKYVIIVIFLSTVIISVPDLFFYWIISNRHCVPITQPPWIASGFFCLSVSLHIALFGIVLFSYTSVAMTLFQSLKITTHNSIDSRMIIRRNKIVPLPSQTELRPTTSCAFEKRTHTTPLPLQTNDVKSIQMTVSIPSSKHLLTGNGACLGKHSTHRDITNSNTLEEKENDGEDPITVEKSAEKIDRQSRICINNSTQDGQITMKATLRETLAPELFENMTSANKRRLLMTTKITFLITITFIISWFPVWIYTVLVYANMYNDEAGSFFLKQSYLFNTFMNPIICAAFNRNFRNKAKLIIL